MKSDLEKGSPSLQSESQFELETTPTSELKDPLPDTKPKSTWQRLISGLKGGGEARGIEPVPLEERQPVTASTSLHMLLMWFSMSLATNNIIVGSMGTFVLGLSFKDAAFCAIFGNLLGVCTVGYVSTWGPISGCRTLIVGRFHMGYYPSKVCCALNVFTNLGYCMVNSVVGGQILSRVSGGQLSVLVGIVIVAGLSWVMAMFGMKIFAVYERFAWLPQLMVLCVMLGSAGPHFDFNIHTEMSQGVLNAKRITFFSLCMSIGLAWAPLAADYYVYYPPHVKRWRTFAVTVLGCGQAMAITILIGIGLGTALASSAEYRAKYGNSPGDLLMMAYDSLGGFGKFCAVINVFALLANNTPGAYSMSMNFQMLGDFFRKVPRPVFVTLSTAIYCGCAMGGRNQLYDVFKSFLPLIGYWVMMFFCIILMEDILFRRRSGYDWSSWNTPQQLPMGIAAGLAFAIGWAGAIVGMDQSYYGGPVAKLAHGADLGTWLGAGFTLVSFPPLRAVELWYIGR
ncbi:uncharacterized protein N7443_001024 [Penicillium atrosanguineum]|uniref:uncharacterized protein n=1 Tax=Penicillium atrosanguineum TaxID=1132637 RepID=UPI002393C89A|nr:uncharacterized protein N7443_001024 [Penicillium atrosanguineum]KAJ5314140.1 hypothetical protein N7443_001024 [Penicillium atrosanguineum]